MSASIWKILFAVGAAQGLFLAAVLLVRHATNRRATWLLAAPIRGAFLAAAWFGFRAGLDTSSTHCSTATASLERATTPMLYVYGSEGVNTPTADCVKRLTELRNAGRPISFHVFEGAGHELGGVGIPGYRFVKGYAELLGEFAEQHVGRNE